MPLFYTKRHTFSNNVIKTSLRKQLPADRDNYPQSMTTITFWLSLREEF